MTHDLPLKIDVLKFMVKFMIPNHDFKFMNHNFMIQNLWFEIYDSNFMIQNS